MTTARSLFVLATVAALSTGCAHHARYDDNSLLYGAVGGVTGAAVGSAVGGSNAALVGGVLGAAAGVAIANHQGRHDQGTGYYDGQDGYYPQSRRHGGHRGHDGYGDRRSYYPY